MKLQVLQEDLSKILNTSIRFVSSRQSLPILANFMLTAEKTKLKVQATNLEMSISMKLGAKIEEEGSVTVPAKSFVEIISNLNQGQLNLVLTKEQLKIDSLGFVANIATMPANDFPKIPKDIDEKKSFQIPTKVFVDKNDLKRRVKLGAVFARESANVIKLKIKEGSILLESESGKVGKENYEIEANIVGGEVEISFNYKFIEDFINSVTADDLEIKLTDGSSPAIFVDPKDPDFLHLIMPVKIQG